MNFFFAVLILATNVHTLHSILDQDIAVSCGSSGNSTAQDGRLWAGDSGLSSVMIQTKDGSSSKSRPLRHGYGTASVPYKTARISRSDFSYVFLVNPGQKFVRLHFNPGMYKGFEKFNDLFSVKAGPYTLLGNFSASLEAKALGVKNFKREFCVNVDEDQELTIRFTPSTKAENSNEVYAFVNGIEIVPMPTGLYFTPYGDPGAFVVGWKHRYFVDNGTALETIRRLNTGGRPISSSEDSIMFRQWDEDSEYLLESGTTSVSRPITIRYSNMPAYIAPVEVYQTSRSVLPEEEQPMKDLTWRIPLDLGFRYLIRLHFCELGAGMTEVGDREFIIGINNQTVEENADVVKWSKGHEVAVHRDYAVMMKGDRMEGKRNLTVTLTSKFRSSGRETGGFLNGLEIFKLSNPDDNLAGTSPRHTVRGSATRRERHQKVMIFGTKNVIATALTITITLLSIAAYHLRHLQEIDPVTRKTSSSLSMRHSCHQFSLDEMRLFTNNFNPTLLIGRGGFGHVYKGRIDNGATYVAIKRMKSGSRQGEKEFWAEVNMLSELKHEHLVSLVGFCNEGHEMILVIDYMNRGTLADHLYKFDRTGRRNGSLSWEQWLKISIGAARGLFYLHTSKQKVIHRDVKSSNILLDENWVAKISDFGLSKMLPQHESFTHVSTDLKGTVGYMDPEYLLTHKLTRKSDVYAFGVVLFEVLSGRPALDIRFDHEEDGLAAWAANCIRDGNLDQIIDPHLMGQISPVCLNVFAGIGFRCLQKRKHARPSMKEVVMALELASALQESAGSTLHISFGPDQPQKKLAIAEEFRYMLVQSTQFLGPEQMPFDSSGEDLDGCFTDMVGNKLNSNAVQRQERIEPVHPHAIPSLKVVAKLMFEWDYGKECVDAFISVRKDRLDECLFNLQGERPSSQDVLKMDWSTLSYKIRTWTRVIKIFVQSYLASEKRLTDEIFGELGPVSSVCFVESSKDTMLELLSFSKSVSIGSHETDKLLRILDMYKVLTNLQPEIEFLYADAASSVSMEWLEILASLRNCVKAIFIEFVKAVPSRVSAHSLPDGAAIQPVTRYVMNHLKELTTYSRALNEILRDLDQEDAESTSHGKKEVSPMAKFFDSIISDMKIKLEENSKLYNDNSLGHIFLMNNIHYIAVKVSNSELRTVLGDDWIRRHLMMCKHHALNYERATWRPMLLLLRDEGLYSTRGTLIKEKLRSFYQTFKKVYKSQTGWSVPDKQLREDLQISISTNVVMAYRTFIRRFDSRITSTSIKYVIPPDDLVNYLLDLFEGSQKSIHLKQRAKNDFM